MYDMNQYAKDKLYRAEKLREAQQMRLAKVVRQNHKVQPSNTVDAGHTIAVTLSPRKRQMVLPLRAILVAIINLVIR